MFSLFQSKAITNAQIQERNALRAAGNAYKKDINAARAAARATANAEKKDRNAAQAAANAAIRAAGNAEQAAVKARDNALQAETQAWKKAQQKEHNEARIARLPHDQMGNPGNRMFKFTNRVRGTNRVGYGNTRSYHNWVSNKKRAAPELRKYIYSAPFNGTTPLKLNEWSKYRNPNMAKAVHTVPIPLENKHVSPEIPLENVLGPKQPQLHEPHEEFGIERLVARGGRSRRKTRRSRKNRR